MKLETTAERLRAARERHGKYKSPTDAARAFGWTVSTYLGHENGDRVPSRQTAKKYASAYRVRWEWLLEGDAPGTLEVGTHLRRLDMIRAAFSPDLPRRLGLSGPNWEALVAGRETLQPAAILAIHEITKLPPSYIKSGIVDDLTSDQMRKLLAAVSE